MAPVKGIVGGGVSFGTGGSAGSFGSGSGAVEEQGPLLPLRILVVADLVPADENNAGASPPEAAYRLDPSRFDDVFGKIRPRLAVDVPSVLARGSTARVDFAPTSLKSFRPDALLKEIPLLRSLLDGRLVLDRYRDGSIGEPQARAELERLWSGSALVGEILGLLPGQAAPPAAPGKATPAAVRSAPPPAAAGPGSSRDIDSLLSMVDVGGAPSTRDAGLPYRDTDPDLEAERTRAVRPYANVIAQFAMAAQTTRPKTPTEAITRIEQAIGAQLGAVLQHPEVRRLEQVYRGIAFLAERAQGDSGIKIDVIGARATAAAKVLERGIRANAGSEPPVSFAVVDVGVDGTASGLAQLEAIAEVAEAMAVPTIVNARPSLLGLESFAGVEKLDHKGGLFEAPQRAPLRAALAKPSHRWVTLAANGALARVGYDKSSSRVREAVVKESPAGSESWVWYAPSYLVATLVVQSFKDTRWPCRLVGPRGGGTVENLTVREEAGAYEGEEAVAFPTEAFLSTDTQRELARFGVLALASAPNSDSAYVMQAPTAYVPAPRRTMDGTTADPEVRYERVSLGDQLFVARLAQFLRALCAHIPANAPPGDVQPVVEAALGELFANATPGAGPEIGVRVRGGAVEVAVRPRRFLGVQLEDVGMEIPLG